MQIRMAKGNFTEDGPKKTLTELFCSTGLTAELHGHMTFTLVLKSFQSVTAFIGNAVILIAFYKESSLHPPSKLLLRCLAAADLCVGLISEPLTVAYGISVVSEHWNVCPHLIVASFITSHVLCGVSVGTLTVISVDRLLALLLGLRYRQVVTLKRTYVTVFNLWLFPAVVSLMWFWNPLITIWCGVIGIPVCLIISIFSYAKIFLTLRHHNTQIQNHVQQPNRSNQLNMARYKKVLSIAIWLQLTLITCYLPFSIVGAFKANIGLSASVYYGWIYTGTLVFLNSSLNPILYCCKLGEVRQTVKDTIRQMLCNIL